MKKLIAATATATALLGAGAVSGQNKAELLVIVTSDDAQVQLMSMVLTMQSAQQGAATRVLLCGTAGDMALRDAPESVTAGQPPRDISSQGLMQTIMTNTDTVVEVCAIYLPGKGVEQSALIEGITSADPAEIAAMMVDPATKVVSF